MGEEQSKGEHSDVRGDIEKDITSKDITSKDITSIDITSKDSTRRDSTQKRDKSGMTDMTKGNAYKLIIYFSIPLLIGNVFQQLYNMVDSIVVGNYIGPAALAAVGLGFPIIFLMSSFFMGVGIGTTTMISQYYGAKEQDKVRLTIGTIYSSMLIAIIPFTLLCIFITDPLMNIMKVPQDAYSMARIYIIIVFAGLIGNFGYNINAGILQGLGDSKTSLLFLSVAMVINIVLDIVFVVFMKIGVAGVAFATVIAQLFSWVFGIIYINRRYKDIKIKPFTYIFDKSIFKKAIRLGIPSGVQQALYSVGAIILQALINSYGSNFIAGYNGANKIDTFAFMPMASFSAAVTTYVGQNIGAGKMDRVRAGTRAGLTLSIGACIFMAIVVFPFRATLMGLFSSEPEVINAGVAYLNQVLPFFSLLAALFILNGVMRGAGEMTFPMISAFISLIVIRVPAAYIYAHYFGGHYMFFSYATGWLIGLIITVIYYFSGRWKNKIII